MKTFLTTLLSLLSAYFLAQDTRTLEQINDSILIEANLIERYDRVFYNAMKKIDTQRKLSKSAGEVLLVPKDDQLQAIVFSKEDNSQVLSEMYYNTELDSTIIVNQTRQATALETNLMKIKHAMMNSVQKDYQVEFGDGNTYLNPIFIPYKEKIGNKFYDLYKLYLLTETNEDNIIPFGRDYLFIAKENGSIFYNLQFNKYMPFTLDDESIENKIITIEYPEREHFVTPTDIYLFKKYAVPFEISNLKVKSNYLGIYFVYNWDRDTLDAILE